MSDDPKVLDTDTARLREPTTGVYCCYTDDSRATVADAAQLGDLAAWPLVDQSGKPCRQNADGSVTYRPENA